MAAVTRTKARPVTPVGYEVVDKVTLGADVVAGDQLIYNGSTSNGLSVMVKATTSTIEAHGIALQDGYNGQSGFSVGIQGEIDGFSGMTPGTLLYPSASVAGGTDTTAPEDAVARMRAVTASRIRYNFI